MENTADCNNLPLWSAAYTYVENPNSPGPSYIVITVGADNRYIVQIAVNCFTAIVKVRGKSVSDSTPVWTEWKQITPA